MPKFAPMEGGYAHMWDSCTITRPADAGRMADQILKFKQTYQAIEAETGVPWPFIGVIHIRESDGDMRTHLHNGDSLRGFTHQVPAGRPKVGHGPPFTWTESAIDALKYEGLDKLHGQWNVELMLFEEEAYNGWGYLSKGDNSPYVWSWTNMYHGGKYVADGVYSSSAVDPQPGTAAMMKALAEKDADARQVITLRYTGTGAPAGAVVRHTQAERTAGTAGAVGAGAGTASSVAINKPDSPGAKMTHYMMNGTLIVLGLAVAVVAGLLIARKAALINQRFTGVPVPAPVVPAP